MKKHYLIFLMIYIYKVKADLWVEKKDEEFKDLLIKTEGFLAYNEDIEMIDKGKQTFFIQYQSNNSLYYTIPSYSKLLIPKMAIS